MRDMCSDTPQIRRSHLLKWKHWYGESFWDALLFITAAFHNRIVSVRVTGTRTPDLFAPPHDSNFTVSQGSPCELGRALTLDQPSLCVLVQDSGEEQVEVCENKQQQQLSHAKTLKTAKKTKKAFNILLRPKFWISDKPNSRIDEKYWKVCVQ